MSLPIQDQVMARYPWVSLKILNWDFFGLLILSLVLSQDFLTFGYSLVYFVKTFWGRYHLILVWEGLVLASEGLVSASEGLVSVSEGLVSSRTRPLLEVSPKKCPSLVDWQSKPRNKCYNKFCGAVQLYLGSTHRDIQSKLYCLMELRLVSRVPFFPAGTFALLRRSRKQCSHSPKCTLLHIEGWS